MMNKEDRLQVFSGYGYTNLGEGENNETLVFKKFENGSGLIMAVHDKYTTQIKLEIEHIANLCACAIENPTKRVWQDSDFKQD